MMMRTTLLIVVGVAVAHGLTLKSRVSFPKLNSQPLDRDISSFLEAAPFSQIAGNVVRRGLSLIEQGVRLDLLASSVKVSENQLPDVHAALVEACRILDFDVTPDLYVQSSSVANAYTLALRHENDRPVVVVTSALLDRCRIPELQAILGHELGHLKCEHSVYFTLGNVAAAPLQALPLIGQRTQDTLQEWRLAAEYTCDRAALLVAQDVNIVHGAMLKLVGGTHKDLNVAAYVQQSLDYEEQLEAANPWVRRILQQQNESKTHPLPVRRVAALEKWACSSEYDNLLSQGIALNADKDGGRVENSTEDAVV